jgi:microsomal epoxide hydrolase
MEALGYESFGVHGGDWGSAISDQIARTVPDRVIGLHLTLLITSGLRPEDGDPTEEEAQIAAAREVYDATELGYLVLNATKPDTVAFGLSDSPAGPAAWMVEKLRAWTDHDGDHERAFCREDILTLLTTYWVTNTSASAGRLYYETKSVGRLGPAEGRPAVPAGVAAFPKEPYRVSRRVAEHHYDVQHWATLPRGGHFPAVEEPELLTDELRAFFRGRA